jgi:hypothetical protein
MALSEERIAEIRERWERGATGGWSEAIDTIDEAAQTIAVLLAEVARLMQGLEDIGQVATYPADTGYAGRDAWDVLWAIGGAACALTRGKPHKLWEKHDVE